MSRHDMPARMPAAEREEDSRPDWDPYSVWLTHIMRSPESANDTPAEEKPAEAAWNPYNVWQSMIKG